MNEVHEPLSSRALASTDEPSGAFTNTRQVMSSNLNCKQVVAGMDPTLTLPRALVIASDVTWLSRCRIV